MADSVDSDEMAHYELSHLDLHCLQRYLCWSAEMKRLLYYMQIFVFQISSIKKITPRLNSMLFKMRFSEMIGEIKPVSMFDLHCT